MITHAAPTHALEHAPSPADLLQSHGDIEVVGESARGDPRRQAPRRLRDRGAPSCTGGRLLNQGLILTSYEDDGALFAAGQSMLGPAVT